MYGRRLVKRTGQDSRPARALAAAIILQAVKDARGGSCEAAAWLASEGAALADLAFDVHPDTLARWVRMAGPRLVVARAVVASGRLAENAPLQAP